MSGQSSDEAVRELSARIGTVVAEKRRELGLSQEAFAEKVGIHRTYVGFIERGEKCPTIWTLSQVAKGLGIKVSELLVAIGL